MMYRQPIGPASSQAVNYPAVASPATPLTLNQIIDCYQAGNLAELPHGVLQLARRKVSLYLTWHEQHPDFPFTVVPAASQLQPIQDGLDTILNARYGLDGMTPLQP